jgi:uncharacterized SAM-binding protein YcdF (DUF218 family)
LGIGIIYSYKMLPERIFSKIMALLSVIIGGMLLTFLLRLLFIFPWSPERLVYQEQPQEADLIVVLDGETYVRIDHAFDLIEKAYGDRLFVPGLKQERSRERTKERRERLDRTIQYREGRGAGSTYEEALETRRFIKKLMHERTDINRLLLVTSPYHSYRAWWIFQKVLPAIDIVSTPVPFDKNWFSLEKLERGSKAEEVFRREQIKFLAYYLLYGWRIYR